VATAVVHVVVAGPGLVSAVVVYLLKAECNFAVDCATVVGHSGSDYSADVEEQYHPAAVAVVADVRLPSKLRSVVG